MFANPKAKVHIVLSEGEQTCVALAAFLTELTTASHRSALVFDDPVTSLDHRWRRAEFHAIPLASIDDVPELDLTVDGTDEFDPKLRLIKGGGGALLREKIVAVAAKRMTVIADRSKSVVVLGKFPLPVEVNIFGLEVTRRMILAAAKACGCEGELRLRLAPSGKPFVSDNGNFMLDCFFGAIPRRDELADRLVAIPGALEHDLFIGIAKAVISAGPAGIEVLGEID